jgi:ribosomal protein S27AE
MADFCKQCSIDIFLEDHKDLANIAKGELNALVICERCGITWVNEDGECVGDCDLKHGSEAISTGSG